MKNKRPKYIIPIVYKKLGRSKAWGLAYKDESRIEVDSTLRGKRRLLICIHELAHIAFPNASEKAITRAEKIIGYNLWIQNYRQVDNENK
jgi:hypothetical protein